MLIDQIRSIFGDRLDRTYHEREDGFCVGIVIELLDGDTLNVAELVELATAANVEHDRIEVVSKARYTRDSSDTWVQGEWIQIAIDYRDEGEN